MRDSVWLEITLCTDGTARNLLCGSSGSSLGSFCAWGVPPSVTSTDFLAFVLCFLLSFCLNPNLDLGCEGVASSDDLEIPNRDLGLVTGVCMEDALDMGVGLFGGLSSEMAVTWNLETCFVKPVGEVSDAAPDDEGKF